MADVKEIKRLKTQCEDKIRQSVYAFEDQSQCNIVGVSILKDENGTITVKVRVDMGMDD